MRKTKLFDVKDNNIKEGDMVTVDSNGMIDGLTVRQYFQQYGASRKQLFEELQKTMKARIGIYNQQQGAPPEPKGYKCSHCGSLFKENPDKCPNCGGNEIRRR